MLCGLIAPKPDQSTHPSPQQTIPGSRPPAEGVAVAGVWYCGGSTGVCSSREGPGRTDMRSRGGLPGVSSSPAPDRVPLPTCRCNPMVNTHVRQHVQLQGSTAARKPDRTWAGEQQAALAPVVVWTALLSKSARQQEASLRLSV
jgi:hypothetical protein